MSLMTQNGASHRGDHRGHFRGFSLLLPFCVVFLAFSVRLYSDGQRLYALLVLLGLLVIVAGSWTQPLNGKKQHHPVPRTPATPSSQRDKGRSGSDSDGEALDDPLRWSYVPSSGANRANTRMPYEGENDLASLKILVLHRPTHNPEKESTGQYPYSSHFMGRRRIWEVRVQVRFKELPEGPIYFGLETRYIPGHTMSSGVKRIKNMLLGAVRGVIGKEFHHSPGDDPDTTEGEAEPPTFAMPLWAIDQFHVADVGEEPDLTRDMTDVGCKRTDGVKGYIDAMRECLDNLSTEKVYTFCFWGISQFVDGNSWEFQGKFFKMDANKLCGAPPVYVVAYQLADSGDQRHLVSRKRYYFKVALWSAMKPPEPEILRELLGAQMEDEDGSHAEQSTSCWQRKAVGGRWMFNIFGDCTGNRSAAA